MVIKCKGTDVTGYSLSNPRTVAKTVNNHPGFAVRIPEVCNLKISDQLHDRRLRGHVDCNPDYRVLQEEAATECAAARPSRTIFGMVVGKSEAAR